MLDELKYIEQFVIYIDLLGIKEFIATYEKDAPQEVVLLYSNILGFAEFKHQNQSIDGVTFSFEELLSPYYTTSVLSDSIIITLPGEKVELLPFLIRMIAISQLNFMMKDVPLRGYITYGKCFHDNVKGMIFGGGLIDAYQKERNPSLVKHPRVMIDSKVIYRLNKIYDKPVSGQKALVSKYEQQFPNIGNFVPFFNLAKTAFLRHIGKDPLDNATITRFDVLGLIQPHYNNLRSRDGLNMPAMLQNRIDYFSGLFDKTGDQKYKRIKAKWEYLKQYLTPVMSLCE